jgi:hypothetical protein
MKRSICGLLATTTLLSTLSTGAMAAPDINLHSGLTTDVLPPGAQILDELEMQNLQGKFIMLPWVFGIAGLDLALISLYWGMYVPNYAPQDTAVNRNLTGDTAGTN